MNLRDFPASLWRFLTWRQRINRLQFFVGYFAICGFGAVGAFVALGIALAIGGQAVLMAVFDNPLWALPYFALILPFPSALIANRAHDLGWPGWLPNLFYFGPLVPYAFVMPAIFTGVAPRFVEQHFAALIALMFGLVLAFWILFIILAINPGQKLENRFGAAPKLGLFGDA